MYDPHNYLTWEWRAEFRAPSREHGYDGEWQINCSPQNEGSPGWVASAGGGNVPEDEGAAYLMAAAPDLAAALAFAKSVILCGGPWTERCAGVIDGALRKARGEQEETWTRDNSRGSNA